jgi:hypothetical protein
MVSIRRSALAKFFAASLFVLVVSPLTAPFSTFDLAEILCEPSLHVDAGDVKLIQDVIDLAGIVADISPALIDVRCPTARRTEPPDVQPLSPLVLRI